MSQIDFYSFLEQIWNFLIKGLPLDLAQKDITCNFSSLETKFDPAAIPISDNTKFILFGG